MKKRILFFALTLCFTLSLLVLPAAAVSDAFPSMTAEQAQAMLKMIGDYTAAEPIHTDLGDGATRVYALVFDVGDGKPGLFAAKGYDMSGGYGTLLSEDRVVYDWGEANIWTFDPEGGGMVQFAPSVPGEFALYPGHIAWGRGTEDRSHWETRYCLLKSGVVAERPAAIFVSDYDGWEKATYTIDGKEVTEAEFRAQEKRWEGGGDVAYAAPGGGVEYIIENIPSAYETVAALKGFIACPDAPVAYYSNQIVEIDGGPYKHEFGMYALRDENGNETNYIRVRELANVLWETFGVTWDGKVRLTRGGTSDRNGTELEPAMFAEPQPYVAVTEPAVVNGEEVMLDAFQLVDANGGGHTYYKLRDLGKALDFNVGWTADRGVFIETSKPYDPAN